MEYKLAVLVGLTATILYFNVTQDYYEHFVELADSAAFWKSDKEILVDRFKRLLTDVKPQAKSVFIGFNGNIDVILNGAQLVDKLKDNKVDGQGGYDKNEITSTKDLTNIFAHYFYHETAAERNVDNDRCWDEITAAISRVEGKVNFIGGNAALMARTMSFNPVKIKLAVPGGPELQKQLKQHGIDVISACRQSYDELHVIMEYGVDEEFGGHKASRANRFIFSRDIANSKMIATDCITQDTIKDVDVVVIAGFHMLETQPTVYQLAIIDKVKAAVASHPLVHLELASMTKGAFLLDLFNKLAVSVHSLGLNEAELEFLSRVLGGDKVDVEDSDSVKETMIFVLEKAGPDSALSRIHFHCLTYHMIVEREGYWRGNDIAVAAGTFISATYACDTPHIDPDNHSLRHNSVRPVTRETINKYTVYTSPVLVCNKPLKTVGLGDSISATGLLYTQRA